MSNKLFKPMLAGKPKVGCVLDLERDVRYPVLASTKLDGVRATVQNGVVLSRNLKPIPNEWIQRTFGIKQLEGCDGELICGNPTDPECFRKTMSAVMSEDGEPEVTYYVFDKFSDGPFKHRLIMAEHAARNFVGITIVGHHEIDTPDALAIFEIRCLNEGYEGAMIRDPCGPYKQGRSSLREGWLVKLKRFEDSEAVVTGYEEMMHNDNPAETNETGHTHRSSHKENMRPAGVLGKVQVRDLKTGVEFKIGSGMKLKEREAWWPERATLVGKIVKYKYFPTGGKDKPRHPIFLGFRDRRDL